MTAKFRRSSPNHQEPRRSSPNHRKLQRPPLNNRGSLPARPNLDQYRKQAKDLLAQHAAHAPDAIARIKQHHPLLSTHTATQIEQATFKLADAQLVIARELGFDSWPKFVAHVRHVLAAELPDAFTARITAEQVPLDAEVAGCRHAVAIVQFLVAGAVSRHDPGIRQIAEQLNRASFCTVLTDLFSEEETLQDAINEDLRFDIRLLARRAVAVTGWIRAQPRFANLPIGYFGSGTGAAASVIAATEPDNLIRAIVSSAGRPDLAGPWLARVQAPMLFVAGTNDAVGLGFTRTLLPVIAREVPRQLTPIHGAGLRFEPGSTCDRAATLARDWFNQYLVEARS